MPAKGYQECDQDVYASLADVKRRYCSELIDAGVTVHCRFVFKKDKEDQPIPCLKHGGYMAAATIKVNGLSDRQEGKKDATITIDEYTWQELSEAKRIAVLHHELYHLDLVTNAKDGSLKRDDLGRPLLKLKLHDIHIGGFQYVIETHKENALETVQTIQAAKFVQGVMPWG